MKEIETELERFVMKKIFYQILSRLESSDIITLLFINAVSLLNLYYCNIINVWWIVVLGNTLTTVYIVSICNYAHDKSGLIKIVRDWYWYPFILVVFKEIYILIQSLKIPDQDRILIEIDKWIFGINPTEWCYQFSNPFLTEFLQICYTCFYFIIFAVPLFFYIKKQKNEFYYSSFVILFGFYVSYIGYLLVPAIGPRFTLHEFLKLESELPGLLISDFCRYVVNTGESIPQNIANAAIFAQRDCFPSGHTEMTLLSIILSLKFKQNIRWIILFVGIGLIIATVYLRYHYVIDVIAGIIIAILIFYFSPFLQRFWDKIKLSKNVN